MIFFSYTVVLNMYIIRNQCQESGPFLNENRFWPRKKKPKADFPLNKSKFYWFLQNLLFYSNDSRKQKMKIRKKSWIKWIKKAEKNKETSAKKGWILKLVNKERAQEKRDQEGMRWIKREDNKKGVNNQTMWFVKKENKGRFKEWNIWRKFL